MSSRALRSPRGLFGAVLRWAREEAVEAAGEVAREAADGFFAGLALGHLAFEVAAGVGVAAGAGDRDHVQRAVELTVAARSRRSTAALQHQPARGYPRRQRVKTMACVGPGAVA